MAVCSGASSWPSVRSAWPVGIARRTLSPGSAAASSGPTVPAWMRSRAAAILSSPASFYSHNALPERYRTEGAGGKREAIAPAGRQTLTGAFDTPGFARKPSPPFARSARLDAAYRDSTHPKEAEPQLVRTKPPGRGLTGFNTKRKGHSGVIVTWPSQGCALGSSLSVLRTENGALARLIRFHPNGVRDYSPGRSPGVTPPRAAFHDSEPSDRRGEAATKTLSTVRTTLSAAKVESTSRTLFGREPNDRLDPRNCHGESAQSMILS